jgi:hypothetical protein
MKISKWYWVSDRMISTEWADYWGMYIQTCINHNSMKAEVTAIFRIKV